MVKNTILHGNNPETVMPLPGDPTKSFDPNDPSRTSDHGSSPPKPESLPDDEPASIGRYQILRKLQGGGFGVVYLGFDDILERTVAIKVPRPERITRAEQIEAYLAEARVIASLEHPAIVRVYDCGRIGERQCFVVAQYIDGGDLADWLKRNRSEFTWAAEVVIRMAEALHHAHKSRIVHRDVKPSNILLDGGGTPFLCDFGLAMREEDFGRGSGYAGTPRYMSPEQARGEGHRVDGRSDIYSLGVVLYELLSGRVPFVADSITELLEQIQDREPPPLRLSVETLPKELERIVLKAMAKRAADRFSTAAEFAADLRFWLEGEKQRPQVIAVPGGQTPGSVTPNAGETRPPRVVPKSLRAFDANDADFFLRLIPGPRDRDNLPESVRFWKSRIEQREASFSVGLLYGPSGCGKTSFVRAGLLPRVSNTIHVVYLEATPGETEHRLLAALKKYRSDLAKISNLAEMLLELRRTPQGPLLLVIDQFEQWLAAHPEPEQSALTLALRQCDGKTIQALLMVRDDFWMAATRFFKLLEIPLEEGRNSAAVDLFDRDHARKVLAGFGRAFGKLPAKRTDFTAANNQFLDHAVAGLANAEGRIVCVRLALFAEMVKSRPWEPGTLDTLGGLDGVGVTFLDEQFGSQSAPAHRVHAEAAKSVLAALLPASGQEIKKTMAPRAALLESSGYTAKPEEFDTLLKILDGELRLITPAESAAGGQHYQLTHDFLVPSLRDWLTRKQRETAKGRAELLLAERAALWQSQPVRRFQPSFPEWLRIRSLTSSKKWTVSERAMMAQSLKRFLAVAAVSFVFLAAVVYVGVTQYRKQEQAKEEVLIKELVKQCASADVNELPEIINKMAPYRERINPLLDEALASTENQDLARLEKLKLARIADDVVALTTFIKERKPSDRIKNTASYLLMRKDKIVDEQFAQLLESITDDRFASVVAIFKGSGNSKSILKDKIHKSIALSTNAIVYDKADLEEGALKAKYQSMRERNEQEDRLLAKYAIALALLDDFASLWELLGQEKGSPQPRSFAIRDCSRLGLPADKLAEQYSKTDRPTLKAGILLALADYPRDAVSRDGFTDRLLADFLSERDSGLHSAIETVLKRWEYSQQLSQLAVKAQAEPDRSRNWSVNSQMMTMIHFRNKEQTFEMGANPGESDRLNDRVRRKRIIPRPFAIGAKEITIEEVKKVIDGYRVNVRYAANDHCPATELNWQTAALFCNYLSEQDHIPKDQHCYLFDAETKTLKLAPDYLNRIGYRLPTDAEWEFAARGGRGTARHYGTSDELLPHYAWFAGNSGQQSRSVGELKPNDYGLFDTLGNANEWTADEYQKGVSPEGEDSAPVIRELRSDSVRVLRGGSFMVGPIDCRSSLRFASTANTLSAQYGFRVARTLSKQQE